MEAEARVRLKRKLRDDVDRWDKRDPRGFRDIVRNAVDLDKRYLRDLMKAFDVDFAEVKAWGSGAETPEDYKRYVIVERIREMLDADLGS